MKPPKSAREQWEKIADFAADVDGDEEIAAMSEADVDRALAAAGVDVEKETAIGRAQHEAAIAAKEARRAPRGRGPRASAWLGAPAALLVAAGAAIVLRAPAVTVVGSGQDAGAPTDAGDGGEEGGG